MPRAHTSRSVWRVGRPCVETSSDTDAPRSTPLTRSSPTRAYKIVQPFVEAGRTLAAATGNLAARVARGEPAYPGLRTLVARVYAAAERGGTAPIHMGEVLAVARAVDAIGAMLAPHPAPLPTPRRGPAAAMVPDGR